MYIDQLKSTKFNPRLIISKSVYLCRILKQNKQSFTKVHIALLTMRMMKF